VDRLDIFDQLTKERSSVSHVPRRWAVLAVLCTAVLVVNIDMTILNVALPVLVRTLHAGSSGLQWIVDAYAMAFGGLLLVTGSLADRLGRRRLFLAGFAVFGVASLGAAFASSVGLLIAWRAAMGVGAAMTIPAGLSILDEAFPDPSERARAVGVWSATIGLGIAIGPLAGGLLLSRFWWGSVFFVNVPILAVGGIAAWRLIPDSRNPAVLAPDPAGAVLSILGLGLLLWAIIDAPSHGWTSARVVVAGVVALGIIVLFVGWEARSDHPMLKLQFFRSRRFSAAILALALGLFPLLGALFVLTQVLQFDLGFSPLQAGVRMLPVAALIVVAAPLSTLVTHALGSKITATAGLASIAGGMWWAASAATPATTYHELIGGMLLVGFGAGLLMPTAADAVLGSVPKAEAGVGSGTYGLAIQFGGALGVAVIGSVLSTRYQHDITGQLTAYPVSPSIRHTITGSLGGALAVAASVGGPTGALLAHAARAAFMSGTRIALEAGALVAAAAALVVLLWLPSHAPAAVSHSSDSDLPPTAADAAAGT
jgi:EmrB/QacA subfamily drug resistance transporter